MTRQETIDRCGIEAVEAVEKESCEMTNRFFPVGDDTEWSASVKFGFGLLTIYYITDKDDEEIVNENGGDWGAIYWAGRIDRYEVQ